MRALCEANSPDDGSPGCFASLRSVQGAAPLAPLMRLSLPALDGKTICLHRQFSIQSLKLNTQILPLVQKTGGIFYLQIKEESTMPTTEKLKQEIADAEKKLAQERSRLQRLQNRKSYYEKGDRKKRAHRLITRGAAVESIAPLVKALSETEFYAFTEKVFTLPEVRALLMEAVNAHNQASQKGKG